MPEVQRPSPVPEPKQQYQPKPTGEINTDQPIPTGEIIFKDEFRVTVTPQWRDLLDDPSRYEGSATMSYTYLGLDDRNNFKVLYKYENIPLIGRPTQESFSLLLPLNDKKQTILRVKTLKSFKRDLLITVVDEFNRITVEEIVKNQTK
jgi:CxxC motif-containing protein